MTYHPLPRTAFLLCFSAVLLSACQKNGTIDQTATNDVATNTAAPVELPPAIKQSATLRCADNSVVYVDFYANDTSASVRTEQTGAATRVTAPDTTSQMTSADGSFVVSGHEPPVTVTVPGKKAQLCKG